MADILVQGLSQNNLKHISFHIPKEKITVFTGVSGSGKSSIVFDTIAAESQRQMNATYPAFVRSRLPKYPKPAAVRIDNLTPAVVVDQSPLGGNARSTVGTTSGLYASLRLLFSRIGQPYAGTASYFSFNDPNGMCKTCSGLGKITKVDIEAMIDPDKSWKEGCIKDTLYAPGSWYWKQYAKSGLFDLDKPVKEYSREEYNLLLYGSRDGKGEPENPKVTGLYHKYTKTLLNRDISSKSKHTQEKAQTLVTEVECTDCHGKRLNEAALSCKINGYSIADGADPASGSPYADHGFNSRAAGSDACRRAGQDDRDRAALSASESGYAIPVRRGGPAAQAGPVYGQQSDRNDLYF